MYVCVFCFIFIFKNSLNVESSHMCNSSNCEENASDNAIYTCEILVQMFSNLVPNVHLCDFVSLINHMCVKFFFAEMFIYYSFKVFDC